MRIRIVYNNEILGNRIFWEGDAEDIDQLKRKNLPAWMLAKWVKKNETQGYSGMWYAYVMEEDGG